MYRVKPLNRFAKDLNRHAKFSSYFMNLMNAFAGVPNGSETIQLSCILTNTNQPIFTVIFLLLDVRLQIFRGFEHYFVVAVLLLFLKIRH